MSGQVELPLGLFNKSPAGRINVVRFNKHLVLSIFFCIVFPLTLTQLNEDRQNLRLVLTIKQKHQHEVQHEVSSRNILWFLGLINVQLVFVTLSCLCFRLWDKSTFL